MSCGGDSNALALGDQRADHLSSAERLPGSRRTLDCQDRLGQIAASSNRKVDGRFIPATLERARSRRRSIRLQQTDGQSVGLIANDTLTNRVNGVFNHFHVDVLVFEHRSWMYVSHLGTLANVDRLLRPVDVNDLPQLLCGWEF